MDEVRDALASQSPTFSFTATKLSPSEVAQTFVPPRAYDTLRDSRNAILVGPRGSGKTTLLKMLTSEALSAWEGPDADKARSGIADVGVFVGVDAMWSEQIGVGESGASRSFQAAAYGLHVARSFCQTLVSRTNSPSKHLSVELPRNEEVAIARRASRLFRLGAEESSFRSLNMSLGDRLVELGQYRYRLHEGASLPDWAYLDSLMAVAEIASMFNDAAGEPNRRWALLFDELEMAPATIVDDILRRLRGNEPRLVFKLSLAPIVGSVERLIGDMGATHGHDVEYIPLTTPERSDTFVESILRKQASVQGFESNFVLNELLGESIFDMGDRGGKENAVRSPYRKGGRLWHVYDRLSRTDPEFAQFLQKHGVSVEDLDQTRANKRSAVVRKARNLVVVREHFRRGMQLGTQATRELYAGGASMMALPDGNPRMSTILVRLLLRNAMETKNFPISRAAQAQAISDTASRFTALLRAQVGVLVEGKPTTLMDAVDGIGKALHRRVVAEPFSSDAPAGFYVDAAVPAEYLGLIRQGENVGAFVHIPRSATEASVAADPRGRHYRLNYLLAPRFGLPIRQGKTVALWPLLNSSNPSRPMRGPKRLPAASNATELEGFEFE